MSSRSIPRHLPAAHPVEPRRGLGGDAPHRITAPMVGGMISSTVLTLCVIPAIYGLVKGYGLRGKSG